MHSGRMTIHQTMREAARRLADAGIDTALLDAEVLLRHVLDVDRTRLFLRYPEPMPADAAIEYDAIIGRRLAGAPVAYLTGTREFMALEFRTTADALIPRPDTEPLVEWALGWLANRPDARIVDIGTGTGAIAVSLAAHLQTTFQGEVIATDISPAALALASENADRLLTPERRRQVRFIEGSLTEPIDGPVDLVLANLPYLTPGQIEENPDLDAEPRLALDGGEDGLDLVRRVVADLPRILATEAAAGFEIDPSQVVATERLLHEIPGIASTRVIHDLADRDRHVVAEFRQG